jgi:hypothetical protein
MIHVNAPVHVKQNAEAQITEDLKIWMTEFHTKGQWK